MKQILFCLLAVSTFCIGVTAQTISVAEDVEALASGETISFKLHIAGVTDMTSMHFEVVLPLSFSVSNISATPDWNAMFSEEAGVVGAISSSANAFSGEGDIAIVKIVVPEGTVLGNYPITINNVRVNGNPLETTADFIVKVVSAHSATLDENSTIAPNTATAVNVTVKRTINANEWSTICLPFAMTEAQVKAAFGDDVQLANFSSWSSEENGDGDIVAINVDFTRVTAIELNHPYIIKVSSAISDFTVDGVDIIPEEEPTVQVGARKAERGYMTGTYVANFTVPKNDVFLSGGKFWYSMGKTKMQAFRAYFEFADVLTEVENASNAPAIRITIGGETTNITNNKYIRTEHNNDNYYNLGGQRIGTPAKGLYIKNGKKIIAE